MALSTSAPAPQHFHPPPISFLDVTHPSELFLIPPHPLQPCISQGACVLSHFSCVQLFATPRTVVCQAPLSMGFSRQESWSQLPFLSLGDLPHPGMEPWASYVSALAGGFFTTCYTASIPGLFQEAFLLNICLERRNSPPLGLQDQCSCPGPSTHQWCGLRTSVASAGK